VETPTVKRGRSFLLCVVGSWSNLCYEQGELAHVIFLPDYGFP